MPNFDVKTFAETLTSGSADVEHIDMFNELSDENKEAVREEVGLFGYTLFDGSDNEQFVYLQQNYALLKKVIRHDYGTDTFADRRIVDGYEVDFVTQSVLGSYHEEGFALLKLSVFDELLKEVMTLESFKNMSDDYDRHIKPKSDLDDEDYGFYVGDVIHEIESFSEGEHGLCLCEHPKYQELKAYDASRKSGTTDV